MNYQLPVTWPWPIEDVCPIRTNISSSTYHLCTIIKKLKHIQHCPMGGPLSQHLGWLQLEDLAQSLKTQKPNLKVNNNIKVLNSFFYPQVPTGSSSCEPRHDWRTWLWNKPLPVTFLIVLSKSLSEHFQVCSSKYLDCAEMQYQKFGSDMYTVERSWRGVKKAEKYVISPRHGGCAL